MFRISNGFLSFINIISTALSFLIISFSIYLGVKGASECEKVLYTPFLILGVFLLVVSVLSLVGSWCPVKSILWIYLMVMFILMLGLFVFTVFTFIVANKGAGEAISGRGFKEYRLDDHSHWLQKRVTNEGNWEKISSCMVEVKVCRTLESDTNQKVADFYKKNLTPIESGCCKPPSACGFTYKNATYWTVPKSDPASNDSDCTTWSNDHDRLCYNCKSCQAGVLANLKKEWRDVSFFNLALLLNWLLCFQKLPKV